MRRKSLLKFCCALAAIVVGFAPTARAEIGTEWYMEHDPELRILPIVKVIPTKQAELWLEALNRPESDLQRMSADAITRGHQIGITGLKPAVRRFLELLAAPNTHPAVRVACARGIVGFEAKETAPQLAEAARSMGSDVRQVVEPALAEWKYKDYIVDWEIRIKAPVVRARDLLLAIRCLAIIGRTEAADKLLEIVHDSTRRNDVRIAAAKAVGALRESGLEASSAKLAGSSGSRVLNDLLAVELLVKHSSDEAVKLLEKFALNVEPAVAVVALNRLLEIDPNLVLPLTEKVVGNDDARVRQAGAEAYIRLPNPDRVVVLSKLLDDPHPDVRKSICSALRDLAKRPELDAAVRTSAAAMLAQESWRGLEQAALLLGALDHEASSSRMQELLDNPRPEVEIAAAWALKTLAIPETLPALLEKTRQRTKLRLDKSEGVVRPDGLDHEVAHLFELFGKLNYAPAESLLREYIPKRLEMGLYSRSSAVWALGQLHVGDPDPDLIAQFWERITDRGPPVEMHKVQTMCLVALGRMKAVTMVDLIRGQFRTDMTSNETPEALRWVLMQLTGEAIPELEPGREEITGWFLEAFKD